MLYQCVELLSIVSIKSPYFLHSIIASIYFSNMNLIFYLLLHTLHFLNNLYCCIERYCVEIFFIFKHFVFSGKPFRNYFPLENSVDNLKLPKHVAILVGIEEISIIDIIKLIDWCSTTRIPYVSFYDHKGNLQRNYPFIKKKLEQQTLAISCDTEWLRDSNSIEYNHHVDKVNNITDKVDKRIIKLKILSYLDGKNQIVSLTKQLSSCHKWNDAYEKDITPQLIGEKLSWNVAATPEPDLAIVFGKTLCSYGFLPWHTRITEFFVLPSHCGILFDDFTRILMKYSRCQQHYGK